jgi:hypothetical protein
VVAQKAKKAAAKAAQKAEVAAAKATQKAKTAAAKAAQKAQAAAAAKAAKAAKHNTACIAQDTAMTALAEQEAEESFVQQKEWNNRFCQLSDMKVESRAIWAPPKSDAESDEGEDFGLGDLEESEEDEDENKDEGSDEDEDEEEPAPVIMPIKKTAKGGKKAVIAKIRFMSMPYIL